MTLPAVLRTLTLALLAVLGVSAAHAQTPTGTTNPVVTDQAWTDVCTAPCTVRVLGGQYALVNIGSSAPVSLDAAYTTLTNANEQGLAILSSGLHFYMRAANQSTRLAVFPASVAGGGSGGSSTITPSAGSQETDVRGSGTIDATKTSGAGSFIDIPVNGQASVGFRFAGLTTSGGSLAYLQSVDGGTTYTAMAENNTGTGSLNLTRTTDGQVGVNAARRTNIRLQNTVAGTGTISVAWTVSVRPFAFAIDAPLPPGANALGSVNADVRIGGAANASGNPLFANIVNLPSAQAITAAQLPGSLGAKTGANSLSIVPATDAAFSVSGAVTANLGTLNGAATAAGQAAQQGPVAPGAAAANSVLGGQVYNSTAPAPTNGQQLALQSDAAGNLKINNATLSPGAATAANQTSEISGLTTINNTLSGPTPASQAGPALGPAAALGIVPQDGATLTGSPFSQSAVATLFQVDTRGYQSIAVPVYGTFVASVVYEASNDLTNWFPVVGPSSASPTAAPASTDSAPVLRYFPVVARYFQARVSAYTSGTVSVAPVLRSAALSPPQSSVGISQSNSGSSNATVLNATSGGTGIGAEGYIDTVAAGNNVVYLKGGAARLYKVTGKVVATTDRFLKCADKAGAGAPGTDTPKFRRVLPASSAFNVDFLDIGASFSSGLTCWLTTGPADLNAGALTAGDIVALTFDYQ